jgi:hypothetical protein
MGTQLGLTVYEYVAVDATPLFIMAAIMFGHRRLDLAPLEWLKKRTD